MHRFQFGWLGNFSQIPSSKLLSSWTALKIASNSTKDLFIQQHTFLIAIVSSKPTKEMREEILSKEITIFFTRIK